MYQGAQTLLGVPTTYYSVYQGAHVRTTAMVSRGYEGGGRSKGRDNSPIALVFRSVFPVGDDDEVFER